MAVRTKDHAPAACHHLTRVLMDDRHVRRHVDAAVSVRGGPAEEMVVFVDGPAHGAKAVVAVGERVRQGKALQAACARRLDDAHEGDVVGEHGVEFDMQPTVPSFRGVGGKDLRGERGAGGLFQVYAFFPGFPRVEQASSVKDDGCVSDCDHAFSYAWNRLVRVSVYAASLPAARGKKNVFAGLVPLPLQ